MELKLTNNISTYRIQSYDQGTLKISDKLYKTPLLIMPDHLIHPYKLNDFTNIPDKVLLELIAYKPEIIIFATGTNTIFINPKSLSYLQNNGIGVEIMPSAAASRTYSVLSSDKRKVLAVFVA